MKTLKKLSIGALVALSFAGAAEANVITGRYWHVTEAVSQNAIPANVPGVTPDVVFDVNSPLAFDSEVPGGYSVGGFLGTGGAFNIVENTAGTLASALDASGVGTLMEFTGFVTVSNGQVFTAAHDDGLTLTIGGLGVINVPGPTAPTTTSVTYSGPSGTFAFQLVYGECCGSPAVLNIDLPFSNNPVPEPGTLALLGLGFAGFAASRRLKQ